MTDNEKVHLRKVMPEDIPAITQIYNEYILHSVASFEVEAVTEAEMLRRMQGIVPACPYFVAEVDGKVAGYCYAHPWKERPAYCHTLETTIYLAPAYTGQGIGRLLMKTKPAVPFTASWASSKCRASRLWGASSGDGSM